MLGEKKSQFKRNDLSELYHHHHQGKKKKGLFHQSQVKLNSKKLSNESMMGE